MVRWRCCAEPGCAEGASPGSSYCEADTAKRAAQMGRRRRRPNDWVYSDPRWRTIRARRLELNPDCCCGCGRAADTVDHRTPIADGGAPFELANTASYWGPHHSRATAKHDGGYGHQRKPGKTAGR